MRIDACARRQSIWLVGLNYCLEQIMLPSALCHGGFLGFRRIVANTRKTSGIK
jgi:hypothetical protein